MTQTMNEMNDKKTENDDNEEIKTGYFGIRSYLHHFYENVSVRNPNEYDEHVTEFTNKQNRRSKLWVTLFISGTILMLLGVTMILIGFTMNRMQIDIGYQEEMRIIDKSAYEFNKHLDQIKIIGLICFAVGGLFVASSLLLPSLLPNKSNGTNDDVDESTHLKFNIDPNDDDEQRTQVKNLIPVTEELKSVQPKQTTTPAIITNSGLKQIVFD
nr:neurensin-1-like isoform X2 [Dermatophagoides farinae]